METSNFDAETSHDYPVFIHFCAAMLRKLGGSPGSPHCAASSSDHDGSVGTDDSSGFYDRSAHSDYDEGRGPGRDAGAANANQPGTDADRTGATGKPQHADCALPDFNGRAYRAERSCSGPSAQWHDRRCAEPITHRRKRRAAFESDSDADKQSWDELRECSCSQFGEYFADQPGNHSQRSSMSASACPRCNTESAVK